MAQYIHSADSPSYFDLNMNKENTMIYQNAIVDPRFKCFTEDFRSPVDTMLSSSTETTGGYDDADDLFLAVMSRELARRLSIQETRRFGDHKLFAPATFEDTRAMSGSPQSTLSGVGSWSGRNAMTSDWRLKDHSQVRVPVKTPYYNEKECWELLYATAGQMERSRMCSDCQPLVGASRNSLQVADQSVRKCSPVVRANESLLTRDFAQLNQIQQMNKSLPMNQAPRSYSKEELVFRQLKQIQEQQQIQSRLISPVGSQNASCNFLPLRMHQSGRLPLQIKRLNIDQHLYNYSSNTRSVFLGGSNAGVKKECAGTGVFLPRPYNNRAEPRSKSGGSIALQPTRAVQELNLNINRMNSKSQTHFHGGFKPEQDVLMPKENVNSMKQNNSVNPAPVALGHELSLPQEWTY